MRRILIGLCVIVATTAGMKIIAWNASDAFAQSGSRGNGGNQNAGSGNRAGTNAANNFESQLWDWLQRVQYRNWGPMPGQPADAFPSEMPHGATVRVFANRTASGNPDKLPHGSILVKENYGPDGKTLMAVTAMYRYQGFDPATNDWYWVKYDANGQVSQVNGMSVAGKVGMCAECHASAQGNDFSFANDR